MMGWISATWRLTSGHRTIFADFRSANKLWQKARGLAAPVVSTLNCGDFNHYLERVIHHISLCVSVWCVVMVLWSVVCVLHWGWLCPPLPVTTLTDWLTLMRITSGAGDAAGVPASWDGGADNNQHTEERRGEERTVRYRYTPPHHLGVRCHHDHHNHLHRHLQPHCYHHM